MTDPPGDRHDVDFGINPHLIVQVKSKTSNSKTKNVTIVEPSTDDTESSVVESDYTHHEKSSENWHDFESQLTLATELSAAIKREQWGSQCEFLMSCISSAVGLGNIWRFPLIACQNGGGAFLIVYAIVVLIMGRPLYMLELALGQFCSRGPVKVWEMAPGFRGVGIGSALASFLVSTFYLAIMSWAVLYLYYSMMVSFPWDTVNKTLDGKSEFNKSSKAFFEWVHLGMPKKELHETEFWNEEGLDGPPVLHLVIALFVSWLLVWGMMVGGVSGSGKIAYFTTLFPYIVLIILLGGGLSLPGAGDGLKFFFTPTWDKIISPKTWFEAIAQSFFSLGISMGGCIMFSSFNSFHQRLGGDILVVCIVDTLTSVLAGTCLFALMGNLAYSDDSINLAELTKNPGAGLAFVSFPNVLKTFGSYPGPNCISALFFFMIMLLAIGSANGFVGTIVTVICDYIPEWKRWIVVTCMCCISFLFGLIYVCPSGIHIIEIVDKHGSEMFIYVVAIFEVIGIVMVYGLKNISNDFEFMLGTKINIFWLGCLALSPIMLIVIFYAYIITYKKNEDWPDAAVGCGWCLTAICWLIFPISAMVVIHTRKSHLFMHRLKASFLPTRNWGPKDRTTRKAWRKWKKTKPTEFAITTKILTALHLRHVFKEADPASYWINDQESPYETRNNSKASSISSITTANSASASTVLPSQNVQ